MRSEIVRASLITTFMLGAVAGCRDVADTSPAGPSLAAAAAAKTCDFNAVKKAMRDYFPGNGPNSTRTAALNLADVLKAHCDASASGAYTSAWFDLVKLFETGLAGALPDGALGAPATGNQILQGTLTMASPSAPNAGEPDLFDPCGAAGPPPGPVTGTEACLAWEGWPVAPDFTATLSGGGLFAVIGSSTTVALSSADPICSGPATPCQPVTTGSSAATWGVAPEGTSTWGDVQGGNMSLVWGNFIPSPTSPTGEALLSSSSGFSFNAIPFFDDFPGEHQVAVTFCTVADPAASQMSVIQRESEATERTPAGAWCVTGGHAALSGSFLDRLGALAASTFGVRPLYAAVHATSPGGGAGGFSDFYAFQTPILAVLDALNASVQDAVVNQALRGSDGQPLTVRARTASSSAANPTGIEKVALEFVVSNNNGTIPSGNALISLNPLSGDVVCSNTDPSAVPAWHGLPLPPGTICRARTRSDEFTGAGTAIFSGIALTKTGGYRATVREWTGSQSQFDFTAISVGMFNVRPN